MGYGSVAGGLYAITDSSLIPTGELANRVARAIAGGATIIQYRDKQSTANERHQQAVTLAALCRQHDIPLIINDNIELAAAVGAAGVHLGKTDATLNQARNRLGTEAIIGVSCYNELERATAAAKSGATYVAFGRFFPSRSKPVAVPAEPALLQQARKLIDLPIVAIGGITPDNGGQLIAAGADLLAAIHGVFGQADIQAAAAGYNRLFHDQSNPGHKEDFHDPIS
jgi:thiamine-phosphate pyrophosphorylase